MSKPKKSVAILTFLVVLMMVLSGCGSQSSSADKQNTPDTNQASQSPGTPQQGGSLTVAYVADVTNFDPIKGTTGNDHALLWPIYDTLVKFTTDMKPEPGLAESWEFTDSKTIVLHLREGVKFSDGTPFNAEAVKFNLDRVNSKDSQISDLKNIQSVEVVDDKTVKLLLSQPDSSIILALSDRGGMMVSPTAINTLGADYSQHPVGAGPFIVSNHIPNGEIGYEANKDYWQKGLPYLDKLIVKVIPDANSQINALKTSQVDFLANVQPQMVATLKADPNIVLKPTNTLALNMLYLRTDASPFNNKAARLAVLYGINRQQLIEAINFGQGTVAVQPFPKDYWAHDDSIDVPYDPEKSKQLLKDAGLSNVSFTLTTYPIEWWTRLANGIKGQLEEVGITVNIETLEPNAAVKSFLGDKETNALTGNWSGRPDPQMTINSLYGKDSYYNPGRATTEELEALIKEAAATTDQNQRAELYKKIVNTSVVENAFSIPTFSQPMTAAMNKKVQGFEPNMLGKAIFSSLWVEQK
ncbi:ABC-type dipeptide transport system, periplasmic component [Desulfitobacterium dichloroeliminans LMG P-21439]|uniref:ABC-type dipeptide transport system, periplasmic component n=1 Tax=Desulfitobacterium dichloroeliminans (strain LMG P-21439 / DCA1) TaxID=871963 RepID=L0F8H8_DESDL|nr:ABC transporter substrate-binding protein [Desulfitobacterium dichloroeliminans]AGA70119.1 ABC-type dipeptide transport system, periplasmic component [Desulfitobacterium dichloroeliminans LMG P-21439]